MTKYIRVTIIAITLTSCSWILGVKQLGDRIYFDYPTIVITETNEYRGVGDCIIPPKILDTKYDAKFVMVKTLNGKNTVDYWLIDKTIESKRLVDLTEDSLYSGYTKYSNVFGPLDSIEFNKLTKQKDVRLSW